jgi:hypothetical protein
MVDKTIRSRKSVGYSRYHVLIMAFLIHNKSLMYEISRFLNITKSTCVSASAFLTEHWRALNKRHIVKRCVGHYVAGVGIAPTSASL